MARIFVAGLINIETTLKVDGFPIPYNTARYPFFGVNTTVSGVGYNVSRALTCLGDEVVFASMLGDDFSGLLVRMQLAQDGIDDSLVLNNLGKTPQSVILYDREGRRAINTDLKDIQETAFPLEGMDAIISKCDLAVICNINFARPMLDLAQKAGKCIATDVHALADINDSYNQDYMRAARVLFVSSDRLWDRPQLVAQQLINRFGNEIVVVGMGREGALLLTRHGSSHTFPAVYTRLVVNTIGAGDALFSCFIHEFAQNGDPEMALRRATIFASYKIGEAGAADGFLSTCELDAWDSQLINV
jgi:sugar/nucleoside kinase (ribokinase family)